LNENKTSLKEDEVEEEFSLLDKLILGNSEEIKNVKRKSSKHLSLISPF